jgi:hypothetical protein
MKRCTLSCAGPWHDSPTFCPCIVRCARTQPQHDTLRLLYFRGRTYPGVPMRTQRVAHLFRYCVLRGAGNLPKRLGRNSWHGHPGKHWALNPGLPQRSLAKCADDEPPRLQTCVHALQTFAAGFTAISGVPRNNPGVLREIPNETRLRQNNCGAVLCGTVSTPRCGAVRCGAVRCGERTAVRCGAVRCGAVRCGCCWALESNTSIESLTCRAPRLGL